MRRPWGGGSVKVRLCVLYFAKLLDTITEVSTHVPPGKYCTFVNLTYFKNYSTGNDVTWDCTDLPLRSERSNFVYTLHLWQPCGRECMRENKLGSPSLVRKILSWKSRMRMYMVTLSLWINFPESLIRLDDTQERSKAWANIAPAQGAKFWISSITNHKLWSLSHSVCF